MFGWADLSSTAWYLAEPHGLGIVEQLVAGGNDGPSQDQTRSIEDG